MIPARPRQDANVSEKATFMALEGITNRPSWAVIHSLSLTDNLYTIAGESDFVALVPGKGIVVIETKAPKYVEYKDGEWYLDRTPKPNKSPIDQLNKATTSIYRFLENLDIYQDFPIARLLWFTSISQHQLDNKSPGDMQFYSWEIALKEDLAKPAETIEKVLDNYIATHKDREQLTINPDAFSEEAADAVTKALLNDFKSLRTPETRYVERAAIARDLVEEQKTLLDLVETNEHLYFDGAAGTGKTYLLLESAIRASKAGHRSLLVCWNVMMAEELRRLTGPRANLDVYDFNTLMLEICGLQSNKKNADSKWYDETLPEMASKVLDEKTHWGDYEGIFVDEFQDIAGNSKILELLFKLSASKKAKGTRLVLAGDKNQQILSDKGQLASPFDVAKFLIPDLVHVRLRTNCRNVPELTKQMEPLTGLKIDIVKHRLPSAIDGGLEIVDAKLGKEVKVLADTLKKLLEEYRPQDIRILSPFGVNSSLAGSIFAGDPKSADERWLWKTLRNPVGDQGEIRWRSIAKFKGLESDVVVITDVNDKSKDFVEGTGKTLGEVLYVGISRAKHKCVLIRDPEFSEPVYSKSHLPMA
jgi:superfamily I DNA/RNA helicase